MNLTTAIATYLNVTGGYDRPMHVSQFGLSKEDTERVFSAWDEDYQISRFMLLTRAPEDELATLPTASRTYAVNGHETSHVTFRADIQRLLKSQ